MKPRGIVLKDGVSPVAHRLSARLLLAAASLTTLAALYPSEAEAFCRTRTVDPGRNDSAGHGCGAIMAGLDQ